MRRHLTVRSAGAVLALSMTLVASGCGSDDPGPNDTAASNSVSPKPGDPTTPGKPGDPTSTDTPKAPATDEPAKLPAGDDFKAEDLIALVTHSFEKGRSAKVSMVSSGTEAASTTKGVIDYSTTPPSMKLTTTTPALQGQESEVLLVGKNMYMNMGDVSDGKYIKMSLDGEAGSMLDVSQLDPAQSFKSFNKGITSLKSAGKEKVGGLELTRYDAVIDTKAVLGDNKAAAGVDMPKTMNYSFSFDKEGMLRRVVTDMGSLGKSTMTYDDWGIKVSIKAPPAKDVTEMPQTPEMPAEPTD